MHHPIVTTLLMALGLAIATPALADRDHQHDQRWQDRDHYHDGRHDHRNHGRHHKHKRHGRDVRVIERHITLIRAAPPYRDSHRRLESRYSQRQVPRYYQRAQPRYYRESRNVPLVSVGGVPVVTVRVD